MSSSDKYIPSIGTRGYYQLLTPFDTLIGTNEQYTLKSVRTISDYIAANEDVKNNIYVANSISDAYQADFQNDIEILGIQSERGAWVYVPITYVECYPIVNGIPYRTASIVLPLQPIPTDIDLTNLLSQLNQVVLESLGFNVTPTVVETSKVVLVSTSADATLQTDRAVYRTITTPYSQILQLNNDLTIANDKVAALEEYILAHP